MKQQSARYLSYACLLLGLILTCLMPGRDSLWIDEGTSANYARQAGIKDAANLLWKENGSEALMPFGMISAWLGAKVLGTGSEFALRAQNIFWSALTVVLLWRIGCLLKVAWLPLVAAVHPFVWIYTNEFRPYAMQVTGSSLLLYALTLSSCRQGGIRLNTTYALLGALLLSASSMLGVFAAIPFLAAVMITNRSELRTSAAKLAAVLLPFAALFLLLGAYYAAVLHRGAGGARIWQPGPGNAVFALYEVLGFSGLGPGRIALRDAARNHSLLSVFMGSLPGVLALAAVYAASLFVWIRRKAKFRSLDLTDILLLVFIADLLLLACAAWTKGFPFWGRHLAGTALLPAVAAALLLKQESESRQWPAALLILLMALFSWSSAAVRFSDAHKRDDYRSASSVVLAAAKDDGSVWWSAAPLPAHFYGLMFYPETGVRLMNNVRPENLTGMTKPSLIVVSKPDAYDIYSAVEDYCTQNGYELKHELTAFRIYAIKPE